MSEPETLEDLQGGVIQIPSDGEPGGLYIYSEHHNGLYRLQYDHGGHLEIEKVNWDGSEIPRPGRKTWGDYPTAEPISDINELARSMK